MILDKKNPEKVAKIRLQLSKIEKEKLKSFLTKHVNDFAWTHDDMQNIDCKIISHHLETSSSF